MAVIHPHDGLDWCHVCGARAPAADIWYPAPERDGGAEHASRAAHESQIGRDVAYLRLCASCALAVVDAIEARARRVVGPSRRHAAVGAKPTAQRPVA